MTSFFGLALRGHITEVCVKYLPAAETQKASESRAKFKHLYSWLCLATANKLPVFRRAQLAVELDETFCYSSLALRGVVVLVFTVPKISSPCYEGYEPSSTGNEHQRQQDRNCARWTESASIVSTQRAQRLKRTLARAPGHCCPLGGREHGSEGRRAWVVERPRVCRLLRPLALLLPLFRRPLCGALGVLGALKSECEGGAVWIAGLPRPPRHASLP